MRVLNVMLSRGLGGIQGAFANYAGLLGQLGHGVTNCVAPGAEIARFLPSDQALAELNNRFSFDPVAIWRAARVLKATAPDAVLTHGRRALTLFSWARRIAGSQVPLVAVLHRHRFNRATRADGVVCVTRQLCKDAQAAGVDPARVQHVPNFIQLPARLPPPTAHRTPPTIGFLGRMVPEKGLDILLAAVARLRDGGHPVRLLIGGDGAQRLALEAQSASLRLNDVVTWLGWVTDVDAFYDAIDIFCVPSRHESFGLVILQAQAAGKAIVATRTVGAGELIADGVNGLLCEANDTDIAAHLTRLMQDEALAARLARQGQIDVAAYDMPNVGPRLQAALDHVTAPMRAYRQVA